ncbi:energy-coupling factor transporter transmembrane component T [Companilactobacillus keshanensis]|uniref:Energy-coupling factor transporter transmembrane component T n=1 Tax=Companilactobacillus keshanensis TaxID=2486003 RepID=A0ABW4BW92_9LACO|nr:energy-coupling factor transporter transmembrane component T [Companilactobacillus keshanensis]
MKKFFSGFQQSTNDLSILTYLLAIVLSSLIFNDPVIIVMIFLSLLLVTIYTKKNNSRNYLKFTLVIFVTTIIFNLIINQRGAEIIFQLPMLKVTTESLLNACILAFSFVNLLLAFHIYDALTNVKIIFDLLSRNLRNIAIIFILTIKFIPKIIEIFNDTKFLYKFRSSKKENRLTKQLNLLEIVLNKSIANFMNMSDVLTTKGYGKKGTRRHFKCNTSDYLLMIISFLTIIFDVVMIVSKIGKVNFGSSNVQIIFDKNILVGLINVFLIIMPILIGGFQYLWWKWYISKISVSDMPTVKNFR